MILVRYENYNYILRLISRYCGFGKEYGREEKRFGIVGLGLECDLLLNNYMLFAGWDYIFEFVL